MIRGHIHRVRWAFLGTFAALAFSSIYIGNHGRGSEPIVGTWESTIGPYTELRFFPDSRMEVRNHFRQTHQFGKWERLEGELYRDDQDQIWGPLNVNKANDRSLIDRYNLQPTGGITYSFRTTRDGKLRWFATEVRILDDKAYFSDYDAWMELRRGKANPFVQSLVNVSNSVGNVFGFRS